MPDILDVIPGLGERLKTRLVDRLGSCKKVMDAFERGDSDAVSEVEGISPQRALSMIRAYHSKKSGADDDILKTDDIKKIYSEILDILKQYPLTKGGKDRINLLTPSYDREIIGQILKRVLTAQSFAGSDCGEILSNLSAIKILKKPKPLSVTDRVVLTDDENVYEKLISMVGDFVAVDIVRSQQEIERYSGYLILMYTADEMEALNTYDIIPEVRINKFLINKEIVVNLYKIAVIIQKSDYYDKTDGFTARLDAEFLGDISSVLSIFDEQMNIIPGTDPSIDRMRYIAESLESDINSALSEINFMIKKNVQENSVSFSGEDILALAASMKEQREVSFIESFPHLKKIIDNAVDVAVEGILVKYKSKFGDNLKGIVSKSVLGEIFIRDYPAGIDSEIVDSIIKQACTDLAEAQIAIKKKAAKALSGKYDALEDQLTAAYELDFFLALGRFANDYKLSAPEFSDCISIKDARNLKMHEICGANFSMRKNSEGVFSTRNFSKIPIVELDQKQKNGKQQHNQQHQQKQQPVSYFLGTKEYPQRVSVLTGANSGGKTTLINTIAQVQLLAQMGLPTPARECKIPLFSGIYYIGKHSGAMNAGAFEQMLSTLVPPLLDESEKMILVDELESVTEPGAAADVIAVILKFLGRSKSYAIFVTHLYEEIMPRISQHGDVIRVDGIEARGLDENLDLVVDRQPLFGVAGKSTPELIVKRLYHRSDGKSREIYGEILENMKCR